MLIGFIVVVALAVWVYLDAKNLGEPQPGLWALGTVLLAIITVPAWLIRRLSLTRASTRTCPQCAETVQAAAVICKHCRSPLEPSAIEETAASQSGSRLIGVILIGIASAVVLLVIAAVLL